MSQLDNLVKKIAEDGNASAAEIIKKAEEEAAALMQRKQSEGEAAKSEARIQAEKEAALIRERVVAQKKLSLRDKKLAAKQEVIGKTFKKAVELLCGMTESEFSEFLANRLKSAGITDGKLILPSKYASLDIAALNAGINGEFSIETERSVANGFILIREGVEYNNSFDSLLSYHRDELELLVSSGLF